jgi:hypothetical protein
LSLSNEHLVDGLKQRLAVVGEVLFDMHAVGKRHDGHQVRGRHLRSDELVGGGLRAHLILDWHGTHIEVQDHQAAIAVTQVPGALGSDLGSHDGLHLGGNRLRGRRGGGSHGRLGSRFHGLVFAETDGLRRAVFGDGEVLGGQAFDGLAVLVFDRDCLDNQLGVGLKPGRRRLLGKQAAGQRKSKQLAGESTCPTYPASQSHIKTSPVMWLAGRAWHWPTWVTRTAHS